MYLLPFLAAMFWSRGVFARDLPYWRRMYSSQEFSSILPSLRTFFCLQSRVNYHIRKRNEQLADLQDMLSPTEERGWRWRTHRGIWESNEPARCKFNYIRPYDLTRTKRGRQDESPNHDIFREEYIKAKGIKSRHPNPHSSPYRSTFYPKSTLLPSQILYAHINSRQNFPGDPYLAHIRARYYNLKCYSRAVRASVLKWNEIDL